MHYVLSPAWLCKPVDSSPPGISVHGTLQVRIMEWVAISSSRVSSWPRDWTHISYVSCIVGGLLTLSYSITKLCPTLCYPMDYSTPGFPVLHYLQEFAQTHANESVMPSNHLILCCLFLLLPSIFPSIRVFSNESPLHIRWPKYWRFQWISRVDFL